MDYGKVTKVITATPANPVSGKCLLTGILLVGAGADASVTVYNNTTNTAGTEAAVLYAKNGYVESIVFPNPIELNLGAYTVVTGANCYAFIYYV